MSAVIVLFLRVLFVIALFTFLGFAIFILWRDLQQTIKKKSEYSIIPITLKVLNSGISHTFNQPEFYIGREAQTDLHIPDETLSAIHARLFYKNDQWMVEDLQSTNGTFINDERLSTPSVLVNGDQITCGRILIQVNI